MSIKIINDYVKISSKHRPGTKRTGFRGVTIHETGNRAKGANAKAHRNYYHNLANSNSGGYIGYHYFVDDKEAYLMHPLDEIAWTNGDGSGDGNMKTISVEICVNSDGDFAKARTNAAYVAAFVLHKYGIKKVISVTGADARGNKAKANLFQHRSWMNKNCPETIRNKGYWNSFVKAVQTELDKLNSVKSTNTNNNQGTSNTFTPYKVKITYKEGMNVRAGAGVDCALVKGVIAKYGITYTIVAEKVVSGQTWGKLKSGAGWICLTGFTKKV